MASAKGGSGKTVLTATFAAFLVSLGKRVLMIDTDAATNGLTLMFLKETQIQAELAIAQRRVPRGIYEAIVPKSPEHNSPVYIEPEIVRTPIGAHLIPAAYEFINTERIKVEVFGQALSRTIERSKENYDFIFLDAQAGADEVAHVAMSQKHTDQVVIVSEYDPLSAAGVERLKGLFREDLTFVRTWVLLNKMLPEFVKSFGDFMEVARYASPIPWDADVVRAYARRRLALDLEKGNEFTLAVVQTLRGIFADEIERDLDEWLSTRTEALREPIQTQYLDAEHELEALFLERNSIRNEARLKRRRKFIVLQSALVVLTMVPLGFAGLKLMSGKLALLAQDNWALLTILASLILAFSSVTIFSERILTQGSGANLDLREERISRQMDALHERLVKLDALKDADVSVLLRHRSSLD
jgi:MinD-like ATPase involved in chromosome partitioning or flagellar assembly/uncharacterized membrane protein